jgi:integrase
LALRAPKNAVQLGVRHTVGPTKGRKARSVPVPQFVLDELSIQCWGKARGDLVFPGHDGGYLPRPKSSTGWFQSAVKRAGVQKITPHDLRHTCASLAVSAGVNVLALQRMLGHTSAAMTLDTYRPRSETNKPSVPRAHLTNCRIVPSNGLGEIRADDRHPSDGTAAQCVYRFRVRGLSV